MIHASLLVILGLSLVTQTVPMKFTTVDTGAHSQIEERRAVVVRTAADWSALWKAHAGNARPPEVDFATSMVIGVFAGSRPTAGYMVEVWKIEASAAGVLVTYREQAPAPDAMVAQMLTAPFHIVRTDAHSGPVTFRTVTADIR